MVIYKAEFPNGKVYIGKTKNFELRKYLHNWYSKKENHKHIKMSKAINKYGFENIKWDVLCNCSDLQELKLKEIEYIKLFNSINHDFGYNMVCGDKLDYELRENFDEDYMIEIVKKKLKSNGHNPDNYIVLTKELEQVIIQEYTTETVGLRALSKKYKISKQRLTRLFKREDIQLDKMRAVKTNTFIPSQELVEKVCVFYNEGKTINQISESEDLTILIVSRILHDAGVRKSKRFENGKRYDGKQPKSRQYNYTD
jgi:hypothetical protein